MVGECPGSPPTALQLWVGGLCCGVAGIGAEMLPPTPPPQLGSGNRTLTQPRDAVRPQPQQGAQREPLGQLRATKGDVQGVLSQQLGPCSLALERGQCGTATPCSCGPHAAVEPRALRSPAACHQRQGQGHLALPLPASWLLSAVTSHHSCGDVLGSPISEHADNGMWFDWGQLPIIMGFREVPKQPCQVWMCRNCDAHRCERGSAPVWDGGCQQVLCAGGGIGTDCAHTYVYHPLTPLRCLAHPSSLHPPLSLTHALGMVMAAHAHIRCVNAAHGWLR